MKHIIPFNESIFLNFIDNHKCDLYKYLGKTNTPIWSNNLQEILDIKRIITNYPYTTNEINREDIKKIDRLLSIFPKRNHVIYPDIKDARNSRFGNCWFLRNKSVFFGGGWDICVQLFEDDWYLVKCGDDSGDFWYLCDEIEGLEKLIKDKFTT